MACQADVRAGSRSATGYTMTPYLAAWRLQQLSLLAEIPA
jgi:hypothetical protein